MSRVARKIAQKGTVLENSEFSRTVFVGELKSQ
jgi:hypothetical protein